MGKGWIGLMNLVCIGLVRLLSLLVLLVRLWFIGLRRVGLERLGLEDIIGSREVN